MKQRWNYTTCIRAVFLFSLLFFVSGLLCLHSQTKIQVVTKTIEKEIAYHEGMDLIISAQKADVRVTGWNRPVISFKLRLVAKHPNRKVAEKELIFMLYTYSDGPHFEASNRFRIPQSYREVESNLKAYYEIFVPFHCTVNITNTFGETHVSQLQKSLKVSAEFGKIILEKLVGQLEIESKYADIVAEELNVTLTARVENANVNLMEIGGIGQLQCAYGKLRILPTTDLNRLTINAARTEVTIEPRSMEDFTFNAETVFSKITVPTAYQSYLKQALNKRTFDYQAKNRRGMITIRNSYSPIVIEPVQNTAAKKE